jgi:hypothetical protein
MTMSDKNSCVLVAGKISIISIGGMPDAHMAGIRDALYYLMLDGSFVDTSLGILRVSPSTSDIFVDDIEEPNGPNGIDGSDGSNNVEPSPVDGGSTLGIALSLSGAALVVVALLTSVYRRRKRIAEDNTTALPEGQSRFDGNSHDQTSVGERSPGSRLSRDVEVMSLSPSARSTARFSTSTPSIRLSER